MPMRAADDVGLGERRVEHALAAELALQAVRHLEHAALAGHLRQRFSREASATSSPKTRMRGSRRISSRSVQLIARHHRVGLAFGRGSAWRTRPTSDRRSASRRRASRSRVGLGARSARGSAASSTSRSTPRASASSVARPWRAGQLQAARSSGIGSRSARPGALLGRVERLVVGHRVRVRPDHRAADERRALAARARARPPPASARVARDRSRSRRRRTIAQAREAVARPRDVAARRLHLDRHRDRVAVVLDDEHDRQLAHAGGVQRLPELALAGRAVAELTKTTSSSCELRRAAAAPSRRS